MGPACLALSFTSRPSRLRLRWSSSCWTFMRSCGSSRPKNFSTLRRPSPWATPDWLRWRAGSSVGTWSPPGTSSAWPTSPGRLRHQAEALGDYPTRRAAAVAAKRQALPWRERRATSEEDLATAYDDKHLLACAGCGISRPDRPGLDHHCPICLGQLVAYPERPELPTPDQAVTALARELRSHARQGRNEASGGRWQP